MKTYYFVSEGAEKSDFVLVKAEGGFLSVIKYIQIGLTVCTCELRTTSDRYYTEQVVRDQRYSRDGIYASLQLNESLYLTLEKIAKTHLRNKVFSKHSKLS